MGKKFFTGWLLWQQMTFVLACGIVATILLGLCKLKYDHYKIRKYTKVEKGKKAATPEMLEAQPESLDPRDEIPFGIRAIESGIEVDGVWISRSNTPVGSSASSINEVRLPRSHNSSQLELPQAIHGSSRGSSRAPSSFDLAVNAERLPTNDSRSSSPGRANPYEARGRPALAGSSRYSNSNITRNSTTLNALEGLDPVSSSAHHEHNNAQPSSSTSGNTSSRTSDETDYMNLQEGRPYEPAYINPRHPSIVVPVDPRWDLDLLQSHRMSHVAETGQLTPRVRRPGYSGDWASTTDNLRTPQEISTANGVDYFVPRQKVPSPPPHSTAGPSDETSAFSASKPNQDGHASNQARQAIPLLETYAPGAQATQQPEAYQPRGPHHEYEEEPSLYQVQTNQNLRESHVLRKVNSGFEILRPGTFAQPPSPEEEKKNGMSGEKRPSKRLQKKRRSSSNGSRTSHFVEQV